MKYISHLDLMRLFGRALRRSAILLETSKGFNRHPKVVIKRALKLGLESDNEEASFEIMEPISSQDFKIRLQAQLPGGINIRQCEIVG